MFRPRFQVRGKLAHDGVPEAVRFLCQYSFSFFFLSPQEELRELREQPTDPLAEQELIDNIEEVYFSSDSFDMVQYELEVCV